MVPGAAPVSNPKLDLEQTCPELTGLKANVSSHRDAESTFLARSGLSAFFRWFSGWFTVLSSTTVPAVLPKATEVALPGYQPGPFQLEWIADSGAGRNLTSLQALERPGIPPDVGLQASQAEQPIQFSTGNGVVASREVLTCEGQDFGRNTADLMNDCPVARSMGEIVNGGQLPFLWLPGQLPCFLKTGDHAQADLSGALCADRVEGNVPIFKEQVSFAVAAHAPPAKASAPSPSPSPLPAPGEGPAEPPGRAPPEGEVAEADSDAGEEPLSKDVRLVREAASLEHRLAHFPKNPACRICAQSRMYRKKVEKLRRDPLSDRGALPEVEEFGERVAADVIIVTKAKDGTDPAHRGKFDPSAAPGLFAGWRLDSGPESYA